MDIHVCKFHTSNVDIRNTSIFQKNDVLQCLHRPPSTSTREEEYNKTDYEGHANLI